MNAKINYVIYINKYVFFYIVADNYGFIYMFKSNK